jgi:hypothetical protein
MRIDPAGGGDGLGAVDMTVSLGSGANPYNYSDMTGIVALSQTAPQGFWKVVYDGGEPDTRWGKLCWNEESCATQPGGSSITARVRTSNDQVTWSAWMAVDNCVDFVAPDGQYLEVEIKLTPNSAGESPVLCDATICTGVIDVAFDIKPMSCPNPLNVKRGYDLDSRTITKEIADEPQAEELRAVFPVAILGTDEFDVGTIDPTTVMILGVPPIRWNWEDVSTPMEENAAECECNEKGGDGLMDMTLKFDKGLIADALGEVHDGDVIALDIEGELYDGTHFVGTDCVIIRAKRESEVIPFSISNQPNPFNPATEIHFSLPYACHVSLNIYNILGQEIETLVNDRMEAGYHSITWNGSNVASGVYLYRIKAGDYVKSKKMVLMK